jgi:hypothetical protein
LNVTFRLFHKGEVGGAFVVVNICQREHRQWDAVKRPLIFDVVVVAGMLITSKKASALLVDMEKLAVLENTVGQRNLTGLKLDSAIAFKGNFYKQPIVRLS